MKNVAIHQQRITHLKYVLQTIALVSIVASSIFFSVVPLLTHAQTVTAQAGSPLNRFAPGDVVPLSVKLTNFGSNNRVDVTVNYDVTGPGGQAIFQTSETVAVETTASYIKSVALPVSAVPGTYTAKTSVLYPGQLAPAVSEYQFTVERAYFGIFQSEFVWYVAGVIFIILFFVLLILLLIRHRRDARFTPHDYSMVDSTSRIYYELISDAIQQMRYHEGDRAIQLAQSIKGLIIDASSGRVIRLTGDPSIVMANLISEYHTQFGRNVNLAFSNNSESRAIVR